MLLFFDIDATLITTNRAGVAAMTDAGRDLHGTAFSSDGLEFAGRLDPLIVRDMLNRNGVAPTAPAVAAFRDAYRRRLELRLQDRSRCRALPGVLDLLGALRRRRAITLGLLTGNYADTGSMKLRACGIEPEWFAVRVWGDDSPHEPPSRDHLPGIGLSRYADLRGARLDPGRATVIGDTPHDVACARAHGCRSLGVATGSFLADALRDAGADHVVRDLSDTESMLRWLLA